MYDAIHYRETYPARIYDCTSLPTRSTTAPGVGDVMPDGTVYAGVSPDTGRPMYTTPKDIDLSLAWHKAMRCGSMLKAHGHKDWRVPTKAELNQLFRNRAALGNFAEAESAAPRRYWSSSQNGGLAAAVQYFRDGAQLDLSKKITCALRCVRG